MPDEMNEKLAKSVALLREDYTREEGQPFKHFFCPILFKDERVPLCMGHVVNKAFGAETIAQRADVDAFYGSMFEADFQTFISADARPLSEAFFDNAIRKKIRPKLEVNGESVEMYVNKGDIPEGHTPFFVEDGEKSKDMVIKTASADVLKALEARWQMVFEKDFAVAAAASLIKASHLTLFYLLGYQYALSVAGRFIGGLLGDFFVQNQGKIGNEIRQEALAYFGCYANMVRPMAPSENLPQGTVEGGRAFWCEGSSGNPFAIGVCIRTKHMAHGVLIPASDDAESVATYFDFMRNSNESICIRPGTISREKGWGAEPETARIIWPKAGIVNGKYDPSAQ